MKLTSSLALCLLAPVVLSATELIIDDFSTYTNDTTLRANWQGLGAAAVVAQPTFRAGEGVGGSNAMRVVVDWQSNTNGTARHNNIANIDLTAYPTMRVVARIEDRGGSFDPPTEPTFLFLGIEGNNGAIWRTRSTVAPELSSDAYTEFFFSLNDTDMERTSGSGSLEDAFADVVTVRLRMENASSNNSRQDVFVDNITAIPEPATMGALLGLVSLFSVLGLRRRKAV